jgi:hypothetical protein
MATGWLGWTPDIALDTPISQINLALAGKIDFIKKTNPWGSSEDAEDGRSISQATSPDRVADAFQTFVKAVGAKPLPVKREANG